MQHPTPRREKHLTQPDQLQQLLESPTLRIIDIRGSILPPSEPPPWYSSQREAYQKAHIPGAIFVDWLQDIIDPDAPVKVTVATPKAFEALMSRLGIGPQHHVVIYDDDGCHIAARLWWIFRHYGHHHVSLLDGGWKRWLAEKRPTTSDLPNHPQTHFVAQPEPAWLTRLEEIQAAQHKEEVCLLDCRSHALFRGEVTRGQRKGHIPGALNVPYNVLVEGPHQTWKSNEALQQLFDEAGVTPDKRILTYCNAGVSASTGLFALYILGYQDIANYDGSWYEWELDPQRPAITEV